VSCPSRIRGTLVSNEQRKKTGLTMMVPSFALCGAACMKSHVTPAASFSFIAFLLTASSQPLSPLFIGDSCRNFNTVQERGRNSNALPSSGQRAGAKQL
jgi:hypothetical protein